MVTHALRRALVVLALAGPSAAAAEEPLLTGVTVGGHGFRQAVLAASPRTDTGRLFAAFETLRTDIRRDTPRRYGKVNGIVRYDHDAPRHTSSMTGRVHYGRQAAGPGVVGADLLSLGVSYDREWSLTKGLNAAAGLQGDVYRVGVRAAGTAAPDTRTTGAISPAFGVTFDARRLRTEAHMWLATDAPSASRRTSVEWTTSYSLVSWLTVDADVAWSWTREASVGVSFEGPRRWACGVRLHGIGSRAQADGSDTAPAAFVINAEAGYRLARGTRLLVDVLNFTNASAADIQTRATSTALGTAARGVDELLTDPVAPRTVRVSVQFGF